MEKVNIFQLIERCPKTRLSKDYENKLLTKIKNNFTDNNQKLFVSSFYCFLNYDTNKDFVIEFDSVWKWLGYSRKDPAKRVLEKHFTQDIDYKIIFRQIVENKKSSSQVGGAGFETVNESKNTFPQVGGEVFKTVNEGENTFPEVEGKVEMGRPSEIIMLTVNTFKKFCLKSGTKKADEVHDYYIKMEELVQETLNEETNELRLQLENKDIKINKLKKQTEALAINLKRKIENKNIPGKCLYFISSCEITDKFKIGHTNNIDNRISELSCGSPYRLEIINIFYTDCNVVLEETIKKFFSKYRISLNCEWYKIEIMERIKKFIDDYIKLYEQYKDCSTIDDGVISVLGDIEKNTIPDNIKQCVNCKECFDINNFFKTKDGLNYIDNCNVCYEIINKNGNKCKQCKDCKEIKFTYEFDIDRLLKDSLSYSCKVCKKILRDKKREEIKNEKSIVGKKQCEECKVYDYLKFFFNIGVDDKDNIIYSEDCIKCYSKKNGDCKQCYTCKKIKSIVHFNKSVQHKDGFAGTCRDCNKIKRVENKKDISNIEPVNEKKCIKCEKYLKFHVFFKIFLNEDKEDFKYFDECRDCYTPSSLQCNKCHKIKDINLFGIDNTKTTGRRTICKECTNERDRKRRLENTAKRELVII